MGIGVSIFLIAIGAVLAYAVTADLSGVDVQTVGVILMVVGVVGLLISLLTLATARREGRVTTVRERELL